MMCMSETSRPSPKPPTLGLVPLVLAAGILLAGGCDRPEDPAVNAASPVSETPDPAALAAATEAWHADRLATLAAPDGWLTLVTLAWLEPGPNRVGRREGDAVRHAGLPADHVGTLHVDGRTVRFEPAPGVAVDGVPADGMLRTDADGDPTVLEAGRCRFQVIDRGGMLAVRMRDPDAPTRTDFAGIERFAVDPAWRIVARFEPAAEDRTVPVTSVIGVVDDTAVAGRARFDHRGAAVDMVLHPAGDPDRFFVVFGDETNGSTTYAAGRFLLAERAGPDRVVLDFNRAYNPPCAFTAFATCPLPVPDNRLPFAVTAGEHAPAMAGSAAAGAGP